MTLVRGRGEEKTHTALVAQLRQEIGAVEFDALETETAVAGLDEIVEYVSRMRGRRRRALTGWASLTPTERRAVSLVVEGLTNPQIAKRMFIARGTVKIHLSHVFGKLNVSTRTQLAAKAVSEGFDEKS